MPSKHPVFLCSSSSPRQRQLPPSLYPCVFVQNLPSASPNTLHALVQRTLQSKILLVLLYRVRKLELREGEGMPQLHTLHTQGGSLHPDSAQPSLLGLSHLLGDTPRGVGGSCEDLWEALCSISTEHSTSPVSEGLPQRTLVT